MLGTSKVSVVIPCYNARHYIATAIRSVLAQQVHGLEIIVVDDGSRDASADLVARQFPQVRLLRQTNQGVAAARNMGIAHAQGEWVAFLDADDLWLPGKLQAQWQALQAQPDAQMAYTAWQVWTSAEPEPTPEYLDDLQQQAGEIGRWAGASGWIYPELLLDCAVWTSTVLVRRSLLAQTGGFDVALRIGEDWDLWLRASRLTPILRVPRPYALYRMHPDSLTKLPPDTNYKHLVVSRALERWGCTGPDGRSARRDDIDKSQARTWSDLAGAYLLAGHPAHARRAAVCALRTRPQQILGWKVLAKALAASMTGSAVRT